MNNSSYLAAPGLQDYIASYVIQEVPCNETVPIFSPPLAMSGFIFTLIEGTGHITVKTDKKIFFTGNAVATGQVTAPVYGEMVGPIKSLLVFFKPTGMHRLFRNDLSELTNTSKTLIEFLGKSEADELWKRILTQPDNQGLIDVLNEFFLIKIPAVVEYDPFEKVLDYIHNLKGNVTISDIEVNSPYQRKTLERHFKRKVGLSPKVYAQIYQFKCLIMFLQANPGITWIQLANQSGYYDQSHMSRYVREYLQVSPNSIVKLDMELINYLLNR